MKPELVVDNVPHPHKLSDGLTARQFITAGNAYFTLRSKASGTRFTYRARKSEDGNMLFISVLTGSENTNDYQYIGHIRMRSLIFAHGDKSKIGRDAPSVKAFNWSWQRIAIAELPDQLEVWHQGKCCRCGRLLTTPESIERGVGPECIKHMEGE